MRMRLGWMAASAVGLTVAAAQVTAQVIDRFANGIATNTPWTDESEAEGNPGCSACDCNSTNAPYAFNDVDNDTTYLVANDIGDFVLPANTCIDQVLVDFMCRYDTDNAPARIRWSYRIGNGAWVDRTSEPLPVPSGNCEYRLVDAVNPLNSGDITSDRAWTLGDVNNIQLRISRAANLTNNSLRVKAFRVRVVARPVAVAPTQAFATPSSVCLSNAGTVQLSASGGSGTTLNWHLGSCDGPVIAQGSPVTIPSPASSTVYFPRWATACGESVCVASASVEVAVAPTPPSVTSSDSTPCAGVGTITLTATGGTGGEVDWYRGSCGSNFLGSGNSIIVSTPSQDTTYFARRRGGVCPASDCGSTTVRPVPQPQPVSIIFSDPPRPCSNLNTSVRLTAVGGSGQTLKWFSNLGPIGEGNPLVTTITPEMTTVSARWETGSCQSASYSQPVFRSYPPPVASSIEYDTLGSYCSYEAFPLAAFPPTGEEWTYEWRVGSCGGTLLGTGELFSIAPPYTLTRVCVTSRNACGSQCRCIDIQPICDCIDFNNNGVFPEDQDVIDFFSVLAGASCQACNDIDFNNNTVFPEDQDVLDFFRVLAGGICP